MANKTNIKKSTIRLAVMAMMAAMAIVVGLWKFPIMPAAPFLEFDFADVMVHLCTLIFGPIAGLCVLLVVCLVQAFFLGGNGVVGLIMHFVASGAVVILIGTICGKKKTTGRLILALILGTITQTLIMIPMNYIFIPVLFGATKEQIDALLLPALIPFNLIKAGVNCLLTAIIYKLLGGFIARMSKDVN